MTETRVHPHDVGLPEGAVVRRRRARRVARWMLTVAGVTALLGWPLLGQSIFSAIRMRDQSPYQVIVAYVLLITSSTTLVLGFWYLLLAQVERVARMVNIEDEEVEAGEVGKKCGNCGWGCDGADRFCRHCGKPMGQSVVARPAEGSEGLGSGV